MLDKQNSVWLPRDITIPCVQNVVCYVSVYVGNYAHAVEGGGGVGRWWMSASCLSYCRTGAKWNESSLCSSLIGINSCFISMIQTMGLFCRQRALELNGVVKCMCASMSGRKRQRDGCREATEMQQKKISCIKKKVEMQSFRKICRTFEHKTTIILTKTLMQSVRLHQVNSH